MVVSEKVKRGLYAVAALVIILKMGSCAVESQMSGPGMEVTGVPSSATLDEPLEFQVTVSHHNVFDVSKIVSRVEDPLAVNTLLERPSAEKKSVGFFGYSHIAWPRSKTYTVRTTLRQMLTRPPGQKRRPLPEKVKFDLQAHGWLVRTSANQLAIFTGKPTQSLKTFERGLEIAIQG